MTNCKLCRQKIEGTALTCSKGTICEKCSKDIGLATYQPLHSFDNVMWFLAETFFRKGQGEEISFEQVWKENENLQLVRFEDLFFNSIAKSKTQGGQKWEK